MGLRARIHPANGFAYASDLIAGLRDFEGLDLFVSAYPEVHPEAPSADFDIEVLKSKQDNGASAAITQFFLTTMTFSATEIVLRLPALPCRSFPASWFPRTLKAFCALPRPAVLRSSSLSSRFAGIEDDEETRRLIATHFTIQQCEQLVAAGVKHFHLYTLNRAESAYACAMRRAS